MTVKNAAAKMERARRAAERRRIEQRRPKLIEIPNDELIDIGWNRNFVPDWMQDGVSDFAPELRRAVRHGMA